MYKILFCYAATVIRSMCKYLPQILGEANHTFSVNEGIKAPNIQTC